MIIVPLKNIHSIRDYYDALSSHKIFDIAPIRDLSHIIDLYFLNYFNVNIDLIHNLFIFIAIYFMAIKILTLCRVSKLTTLVISNLILFHPSLINTVLWVSARKHILASLFILIATYYLMPPPHGNGRHNSLRITISYIASVLSWPIFVLFPFSILINKSRTSKLMLGFIFFIMFIFLYLNYHYYNETFPQQLGILKSQNNFSISEIILGSGRVIIQALIPYYVFISYAPSSYLNLIGIAIGPIFFYFTWKKLDAKTFLLLIVMFLSPLLIVFSRPTAIFLMDSYSFIPIFFIFVSIGIILEKTNHQKISQFTALIILLLFLIKDYQLVQLRLNPKNFIKISFENEPNCLNTGAYLKQSWDNGSLNFSIDLYRYFTSMGCRKSNLHQIHLYAIFVDKNITTNEKIKIFNSWSKDSLLAEVFKNKLISGNDNEIFIQRMNQLFEKNPNRIISIPFSTTSDPALKKAFENCQQQSRQTTKCHLFLTNLNSHYELSTFKMSSHE